MKPSLPIERKYLFVALIGIFLLAVLAPDIAIRDADAYAYLIGSYSIRQGSGYADLLGTSLIHWPPGYSLLVSIFPDALAASKWINYIAFGVTLALVFFLARESEWNYVAAGGLCAALGFGFFRSIATNASPDILQYALFLLGVLLYTRKTRRARLWGLILWALIVPLKYIGLVFVPAGLVLDWRRVQDGARLMAWQRALAGAIFVLVVASLVFFNFASSGEWVSASHNASSFSSVVKAFSEFVITAGRGFVSYWYGSIKEPLALVAFALMLVWGIAAFATLRRARERVIFFQLGILILLFSGALTLVRDFGTSWRLMGYGPLTLLFGLRPLARWNWVWLGYGITAVCVGLLNMLTTNAVGANDPRYQLMAQKLETRGLPAGVIASNSFHILDVQLHHPSTAVSETPRDGKYYLYVKLPAFDEIASSVTPLPPPEQEWCLMYEIDEAQLYQRCDAP